MIVLEPSMEAVRDTLRDNLTNITQIDKSIRITVDEKVPAYSGEEFIGVFGSEVQNIYRPDWIQRRLDYSIKVAITRRLSGTPLDQHAETIYTQDDEIILRAKSSMASRAHEIIKLIDGQWDVINLIQSTLVSSGEDICVMTPFGLLSVDAAPEEVFADHFRILDVENDTDRPIGLSMVLEFGGLQTYQNKIADPS